MSTKYIHLNEVPEDLNLSTLHHLCAERAREYWRLWNDGYPVVRLLDHTPSEEFGYTYILDDGFMEKDNPIHGYSSISPIALASFLIDLMRMENEGVCGRFKLCRKFSKMNYHNSNHTELHFALIPDLSDIVENTFEPTNFLKIAKEATKLIFPQDPNISKRTKITTILNNFPEKLKFRFDKTTTGNGELIIDIDDRLCPIWIGKGSERFRYSPSPFGNWLKSNDSVQIDLKNTISLEVTLDPYPDNSRFYFLDRALNWNKATRLGFENHNRGILGTIAAELRHSENSCYRYKLIEQNIKQNRAQVRVERIDKKGNAHDIYDTAIAEKEMTVALNSSRSVFEWEEIDECGIIGIEENDPFLLNIKTNGNIKEEGYLKLASVPHRSLMKRKEMLIKNGMAKQSVNFLTHLRGTNVEGWRLNSQLKTNIMALQGPPGTGKTWTACNVIKDILERNPCARILVSSKEHLALDHLCNRVRETLDDSFDVVRINNSEASELESDLDSRVLPEEMTKQMLNQLSISKSIMKEMKKTATWIENLALRTASVVCVTSLDREFEHLQNSQMTFDFAIIEEAGKSYPSELIGPISVSMCTLLIGDQMQLPPFELERISSVVDECIDEGIKLQKNKGERTIEWELVGISTPIWDIDTPQWQNNTKNQIVRWLQPFNLIHEITRGDILSNQWRMFPSLSDAVGQIFYRKKFKIKKQNRISDNQLPGIFRECSSRLIFKNSDGKESKLKNSYCNKEEAKIASKNLIELLEEGHEAITITPYKGQVEEIRKNLPKKYREMVRTVDGFQGKEADFIILSLVRNNDRTGASRRWGFFRDPRRINVALSRAREGILLVSSKNHIENTDWSTDEGQLVTFLNHIKKNGKMI